MHELTERDPQGRAEVRAEMENCAENGDDPLAVLESWGENPSYHAGLFGKRYVSMLLTRPDSAGAADWMRDRVRCAEMTPGEERIHYRRPMGKAKTIWDRADTKSFIKRAENGE